MKLVICSRIPQNYYQMFPEFFYQPKYTNFSQMNRDRGEAASVRAAETLAARETTPGGPPVGLQPGQVAANPAQYVTGRDQKFNTEKYLNFNITYLEYFIFCFKVYLTHFNRF
jgi:hypothetical protein